MNSVISIQAINKTYNQKIALDNVSLEIFQGEMLGFVGPNGAGKSTTIKVLLNYIFADSGSATILGFDVVHNSKIIKEHVGYVPSEVNFYPELTCMETIQTAMDFHHTSNPEFLNRIITSLQIEPHKKMKALSLGNKKKVAIACALVHNPKIVILDEPTNGLDPLVQISLFELLNEMRSKGATIFISSHNLKEIQDHCDRVAFIKGGKIEKVFDLNLVKLDGKYIKIKADTETILTLSNHIDEIKKQTENKLNFVYRGDMNQLLKLLNNYHLEDLSIESLSLEHEFMDYYKELPL